MVTDAAAEIGCLEHHAMGNGDDKCGNDQSVAVMLDPSITANVFVPISKTINTRLETLTEGVLIDLDAPIVGAVAI